MFAAPEKVNASDVFKKAESNTVIRKNDKLQLAVYTNAGERIIDPSIKVPESGETQATPPQYVVDQDGAVKFPLLDKLKIEGLTVRQAEAILEKEYSGFYKQPFVRLDFTNKRVVVLGSPGGQVIPLANENTRLTEVLALAKGINMDGKSANIKVLRGQELFIADFSTFDSYKTSDILVEPGDIIYVEPIARPFREGLRDYGPFISIITSIATLIVIITQTN